MLKETGNEVGVRGKIWVYKNGRVGHIADYFCKMSDIDDFSRDNSFLKVDSWQ